MQSQSQFVKSLLSSAADAWHQSPASVILVGLFLLVLFLASIQKILETLTKWAAAIADALRFIKLKFDDRSEQAQAIRGRTQFLRVLASDLAAIAKAEAWNDQYFTDMEAEVEVEGGYYSGIISRIFKRRSFGRRREKSLMRAIERSSERCLLVTGDPGAGKSVALRHLASQMADRSIRKSRRDCLIPLYVNLRDLAADSAELISVDAIKAFVIDNVRRGDADTAEYLNTNWKNFSERGIWFFLFDSFDEIPAVMHAGVNEGVVAAYGDAIRAFMDGLGSCRGVLASREYKRPPNTVWPKLRILPLGERRQMELVNRTFLKQEDKREVLRAVSVSSSATFTNPLFLMLLCRYVKENRSAPKDEHELLYSHVKSLANRDADYVNKKWGLSTRDLLNGASSLAGLFAASPSLGLAPTVDEIQRSVTPTSGLDHSHVQTLVEALTYVKIGRTDVQSNDPSVRRFAFSHRRYQECLVAVNLVNNIDSLDLVDLLTDAQMREYVVAMLQIGDQNVAKKLSRAASAFVQLRTNLINSTNRRFFGTDVQSIEWNDAKLEHVLNLFLDAQRYHPDGTWVDLEGAVESLLSRAWRNGDAFDRRKVLVYCSLGNRANLSTRLTYAMDSGIGQLEDAALNASRFLVDPRQDLRTWVRKHVAGRMISSESRFDFLRWESLAVELPAAFELEQPAFRAARLMSNGVLFRSNYLLRRFGDATSIILLKKSVISGSTGHRRLQAKLAMMITFLAYWTVPIGATGIALVNESKTPALSIIGYTLLALCSWILSLALRILYFDEPKKLRFQTITQSLIRLAVFARDEWRALMLSLAALCAPGLAWLAFCNFFGLFPGESPIQIAFLGSISFIFFAGLISTTLEYRRAKRADRKAKELLSSSKTLRHALAKAPDPHSLASVVKAGCHSTRTTEELRGALAYLSAAIRTLDPRSPSSASVVWHQPRERALIRRSIEELFQEIDQRLLR
jgi:hypothetical protein